MQKQNVAHRESFISMLGTSAFCRSPNERTRFCGGCALHSCAGKE